MSPKPKAKDVFQHPLYRNVYLKKRGDIIYYHIHYDGEEIRKSTGMFWAKANFNRALEIAEAHYDKLTLPGTNKYNLNELFEQYLNFKSKSVTKVTIKKYRQAWNNFILKDYQTSDIQQLRQDLVSVIATTHLGNNTTVKLLQLLSAFFEYCLENNYIMSNPVVSSILPKTTKAEPRQYEEAEIQKLINYFKDGSDMNLLIRLIANTGLRVEEAVNLRNSDIMPDRLFITGKGGAKRTIPIFPGSRLEVVTNILKNREKPFPWQGTRRPHLKMLKAVKKLNFELSGFHAIRKYFENKLIDAGVNVKIVAELLGHTVAIQAKNYITRTKFQDLKKVMGIAENIGDKTHESHS
jgi:integrase